MKTFLNNYWTIICKVLEKSFWFDLIQKEMPSRPVWVEYATSFVQFFFDWPHIFWVFDRTHKQSDTHECFSKYVVTKTLQFVNTYLYMSKPLRSWIQGCQCLLRVFPIHLNWIWIPLQQFGLEYFSLQQFESYFLPKSFLEI